MKMGERFEEGIGRKSRGISGCHEKEHAMPKPYVVKKRDLLQEGSEVIPVLCIDPETEMQVKPNELEVEAFTVDEELEEVL